MFCRKITVAIFLLVMAWWSTSAPSSASPLTAAPACSASVGEVQRLKLSSLQTGDTVTVCASWLITASTSVNAADQSKPKNVDEPIKRVPPVTKVIAIPQKRFMSASPDRPVIKSNVYESAAVNFRVLLASTATRHQHLALLLAKPTLLRFTPVGYRWTLGDGIATTRSQVAHRYKSVGNFVVRMSVTYKSEVRVLPSTKWIRLPFLVSKTALPVTVKVAQANTQGRKVPVLVKFSCKEKPEAVGC